VALFGRKINNAEHQLAFVEMLRRITDGQISPEEAVRAYHGVLQAKGIKPKLDLEKDLVLTDQTMSYDGNARAGASVAVRNNPLATQSPRSPASESKPSNGAWPVGQNGAPAFDQMDSTQRRAYDEHRLTRKFG
jgi:hypothetical protein